MKKLIIRSAYIIAIATILIICGFAMDKVNHYSVPATVYGLDYDGYTLFETEDGNLWAYELPDHLAKGTHVTLNMYDMTNGESRINDIILSVTINDKEVKKTDKEINENPQ